ncbi:MAG: hypothetical protein HYR59_06075 [Acidobacteria bacterium]|nr:hypothetical protein [Acidobacteriota bacterium]
MKLRVLIVAVVAASLAFAQASKPNFSGTWEVDPSRSTTKVIPKMDGNSTVPSTASPPPPPSRKTLPAIIVHREARLDITRPNVDVETPTTLRYTTDGAENVNTEQFSTPGMAERSNTRWEGNKLVTEWRLEHNGKVVLRARMVRSLSADGKTMTEDQRIESATSIRETHTVWTKQK